MKKKLIFLFGFFLVFPVFITKNFQIFNGDAEHYIFSVPMSIIIAGCIFFATFLRFFSSLKETFSILFLFFLLFLALIYAVLDNFNDPSLLALYLVPAFLGFFLPWCLRIDNEEEIVSFMYGFSYSLSLVAGLHLIASFYTYGIQNAFVARGVDSIFGYFSIYQKFIYYSTLLAIACLFVMRHMTGIKKIIILTLLITDILMIGSREALVLVLVFFTASLFFSNQKPDKKLIYTFCFIFFALVSYFIGYIYFSDVALIAKLETIFSSGDLSAGRFIAIDNVVNAFDMDFNFFIFGSGFSVNTGELATPHNQYIEWFLRGGLLWVIFSLFFLLYPTLEMLISTYSPTKITIGIMLLAIIVVSNNINTPFRAPYISLPLWVIIGISFRLIALQKKSVNKVVAHHTTLGHIQI